MFYYSVKFWMSSDRVNQLWSWLLLQWYDSTRPIVVRWSQIKGWNGYCKTTLNLYPVYMLMRTFHAGGILFYQIIPHTVTCKHTNINKSLVTQVFRFHSSHINLKDIHLYMMDERCNRQNVPTLRVWKAWSYDQEKCVMVYITSVHVRLNWGPHTYIGSRMQRFKAEFPKECLVLYVLVHFTGTHNRLLP